MIETLGSWREGILPFLQSVGKEEVIPWNLGYEDRREVSREPRVVRQLSLEKQWKGTFLEGVWYQMRRFARPADDYKITLSHFNDYLEFIGIHGEHLRQKLFYIFKHSDTSTSYIDCIRLCKALYMGLTDEKTATFFIEHCYRSLPLNSTTSTVDLAAVTKARSMIPSTKKKSQKMCMEMRMMQLDLLERFLEETGSSTFDIETFGRVFFDEGWRLWSSTFIKPIFECAAKYFRPPPESFPAIPLRWTRATEPIPYSPYVLHDADSLLLRNVEFLGKENADSKRKKRRRKKK